MCEVESTLTAEDDSWRSFPTPRRGCCLAAPGCPTFSMNEATAQQPEDVSEDVDHDGCRATQVPVHFVVVTNEPGAHADVMMKVQMHIIDPLVKRKILLESRILDATPSSFIAEAATLVVFEFVVPCPWPITDWDVQGWRRRLGAGLRLVVAPAQSQRSCGEGDEQAAKTALARAMILPPARQPKQAPAKQKAIWVGSCVERERKGQDGYVIPANLSGHPCLAVVDEGSGKRLRLSSDDGEWSRTTLLSPVMAAALAEHLPAPVPAKWRQKRAALSPAVWEYGRGPPASSTLSALQNGVAGVLLVTFGILLRVIHTMIPGMAVVLVCYTIYRLTKANAWNRRTALLLTLALLLTYSLIRIGSKMDQLPAEEGMVNRDETGREIRSGELVLLQNGEVALRPHPQRDPGTAVPQDWRDFLAQSIQYSLMSGSAQVVLEFTRRGCAYCHKQLPVLQEAVQRRASATGALAPGLAFAGAAPRGNVLFAPLRIFILDAEEFQELAAGFQVQAYPTLWIFGLPRVEPVIHMGFLDGSRFDQLLRTVALKPQPPEEKPKKKGRGWFRCRCTGIAAVEDGLAVDLLATLEWSITKDIFPKDARRGTYAPASPGPKGRAKVKGRRHYLRRGREAGCKHFLGSSGASRLFTFVLSVSMPISQSTLEFSFTGTTVESTFQVEDNKGEAIMEISLDRIPCWDLPSAFWLGLPCTTKGYDSNEGRQTKMSSARIR
eukprot:s643_g17.t2